METTRLLHANYMDQEMSSTTLRRNGSRKETRKKSAVVMFNNQDSVLMSMQLTNILCLLHDNRIFAFKKSKKPKDFDADGFVEPDQEQDIVLRLLTTARYRAMKFLYSGYHLIDNTSFLLLIVMSIYNSRFRPPTDEDKAIFAAIGLEAFYGIMLYSHRYWILQRLSFCIGIVLYFVYFSLVTVIYQYPSHVPAGFDPIVALIVLGIRLIAFLLEKFVDVAIDIQLHNDLCKLSRLANTEKTNEGARTDFDLEIGSSSDGGLRWDKSRKRGCLGFFKHYLSVSNNPIKMPMEVNYLGSAFAWGPNSVFDRDVWTEKQIHPKCVLVLCLVPGLIALLVLIPVCILCFVAWILLLGPCSLYLWCTKGKCTYEWPWNWNYWKEIIHF